MKLGKLSLVAVMALGTSAFAIDNVKVNGEAKLWYQTSETANNPSYTMFNQPALGSTNAMAHAALTLGATADLLKNVSSGVEVTAVSTLGLENNLVGNVPATRDGATGLAMADDQSWVSELWLAYTAGKTTAKIGRQELATPLAFTEKWNSVKNTFEAAVLLNNDLPDTTLVAAWVGKDNSSDSSNTTVKFQGKFSTFGAYGKADGAYAFGAINKSLPNTTVQAWYYDVQNVANAYWLQADTKVAGMVDVGVQYASMNPNLEANPTLATNDIYAVRVGGEFAGINAYAAYSSADKGNGATNFSNVATNDKSMIYTAAASIYFDGENTTKADTDAWRIGASTKMVPGVTLGTSYGSADAGTNGGTRAESEYTAWDLSAAGKVGPLDLTAIYTQYEVETSNVKVTDTDTLRIIASLKF